MLQRRGLTLVELLVVIGILALLMSLLIPAVQQVRQLVLRAQDQANIKQITLALQHYAADRGGQLPARGVSTVVSGWLSDPPFGWSGNDSPLYNIIPFLEASWPQPYAEIRRPWGVINERVKVYLSPTDPTVQFSEHFTSGPSSYAVNMQVFLRPVSFTSIRDGTAHTIAVAQHYYLCGNRDNNLTYLFKTPVGPHSGIGSRSGTFADPFWLDVVPVISGRPPVTRPSIPGVTFQVAPAWEQADGRMLQATQPAGLLVGMFDGSVRTYAPSVSEHVFWSAVTPIGEEVPGME